MKFKDYLEALNQYAKENPECLEMWTVASSDDEGNNFSPVVFTCQKGNYSSRGGFIPAESFEDAGLLLGEDFNAVCIN